MVMAPPRDKELDDALEFFNQLLAGGGSPPEPPKPDARPQGTTTTRTQTPFTFTKGPGEKDADELRAMGYIPNPLRPDNEFVKPGTWEVYRAGGAGGFYRPTSPIPNFGTGAVERIQIQQSIRDANRGAVPPIGAPTNTAAPQNSIANVASQRLLDRYDVGNVVNRRLQEDARGNVTSRWQTVNPRFDAASLPQATVPETYLEGGMDTRGGFQPTPILSANAPPLQLAGPQTVNINGGGTGFGFGFNPSMILAQEGMPSSGDPATDAWAAYLSMLDQPGVVPDWSAAAQPAINAPMVGLANGGTVITGAGGHPAAIIDVVTGQPLAITSEFGQPEVANVSANGIQVQPINFAQPQSIFAQPVQSYFGTLLNSYFGQQDLLRPFQPRRPFNNQQQQGTRPPGGRLPVMAARGVSVLTNTGGIPPLRLGGPSSSGQTVYGTPPVNDAITLRPPAAPFIDYRGSTDMRGGGGGGAPPVIDLTRDDRGGCRLDPSPAPPPGPAAPGTPQQAAIEQRQRDVFGYRNARAGLPAFTSFTGPATGALPPGIFAVSPESIQSERVNELNAQIAALGNVSFSAEEAWELANLQAALEEGNYFRGNAGFLGNPGDIAARIEALRAKRDAAARLPTLQQQLTNLGR